MYITCTLILFIWNLPYFSQQQKLNILLKDVEQLHSDKASALTEAIRYKVVKWMWFE